MKFGRKMDNPLRLFPPPSPSMIVILLASTSWSKTMHLNTLTHTEVWLYDTPPTEPEFSAKHQGIQVVFYDKMSLPSITEREICCLFESYQMSEIYVFMALFYQLLQKLTFMYSVLFWRFDE